MESDQQGDIGFRVSQGSNSHARTLTGTRNGFNIVVE